jgi:hypothetical protein
MRWRRERRRSASLVIPGPSEARNPESIATDLLQPAPVRVLKILWLWIPGSRLRRAPE